MDERKQLTLYESMFKAIRRIRKKSDRCDAYDAVLSYGFYQAVPDMEALPDAAAIAFDLIRPIFDSARKKAESGKQGGSKPKANAKQTEREKEGEKEIEIENEWISPHPPHGGSEGSEPKKKPREADFDRFWAAYPKKVGKQAARKAFDRVKTPVETLLTALERQKRSDQWSRDAGQYIPNPATWLNQGRWEDELPEAGTARNGVPMGGGTLGEAELEAIRRMLEEPEPESREA